jgi:hypothetical protein
MTVIISNFIIYVRGGHCDYSPLGAKKQGYASGSTPASRRQKCDFKQVPHEGPSIIWRHRTKFKPLGDLAGGICAPLTSVLVILKA